MGRCCETLASQSGQHEHKVGLLSRNRNLQDQGPSIPSFLLLSSIEASEQQQCGGSGLQRGALQRWAKCLP